MTDKAWRASRLLAALLSCFPLLCAAALAAEPLARFFGSGEAVTERFTVGDGWAAE